MLTPTSHGHIRLADVRRELETVDYGKTVTLKEREWAIHSSAGRMTNRCCHAGETITVTEMLDGGAEKLPSAEPAEDGRQSLVLLGRSAGGFRGGSFAQTQINQKQWGENANSGYIGRCRLLFLPSACWPPSLQEEALPLHRRNSEKSLRFAYIDGKSQKLPLRGRGACRSRCGRQASGTPRSGTAQPVTEGSQAGAPAFFIQIPDS